MEWQSIETAPKDGTQVLARVKMDSYPAETRIICYYPSKYFWSCEAGPFEGEDDYEPTHWMPLPPAPETDQ